MIPPNVKRMHWRALLCGAVFVAGFFAAKAIKLGLIAGTIYVARLFL
jgi:hypothetical protein